MTTSNTHIRIRRSSMNAAPSLLQAGELAYSYVSNTLFLGTVGGDGVLKLGGEAYTTIIEARTAQANANTLILRDDTGSFSANVITANNFYGALASETGVSADTYGSSTQVPVITVAANGLVTNVTTAAISTTMNFSDGTNDETLNLIDGTLDVLGENGITTIVTANTITVGVDDTIMRSNTEGGPQHISTDIEISGNLTVQGTTTYVQTSINQTDDSMIELAANNTVGDVVDIGFYGKHEGVDGTVVTGLVRNAGTSDYYLFDNIAIGDQANLTSNIITQESLTANGASLYAKAFFAAEGGTNGTGYSFGLDQDTGMFSSGDGHLEFYSNNVKSGEINVNNGGTSFGLYSASTNQGYRATAIGYGAGATDQGGWSVAVGLNAGSTGQGNSSVAVGHRAGGTNQGSHTVAVGVNSGQNTQGQYATAIGYRAGYGASSSQGAYSLALGTYAGRVSQVDYSIAINASGQDLNPTEAGLYIDPIRANNAIGGNVTTYNTTTKEVVYTDVTINSAGITLANGTTISDSETGFFVNSLREDATANDIVYYNADTKELTYGTIADIRADVLSNGSYSWSISGDNGSLISSVGTVVSASADSVSIGQNIDLSNSNTNRVAIGNSAGQTGQGYGSTAVGENAGQTNQSYLSVALGLNAGNDTQGHSSVAVGHTAGRTNQGNDAVAIGVAAGKTSQGQYAVAIGERAGYGDVTAQGDYSIAIGSKAGYSSAFAGSIIFNASGSELNSTNAGLYINPIRYVETQDVTYDGLAFYNASTKEMTYSYILDGGDF